MTQQFFEKRIKPLLMYVGIIGSVIMSIAYILIMMIMILGFEAQSSLEQRLLYAGINAIWGFIIMQFLKIQGITFAENLEQNKKIIEASSKKKLKKEKFRSINYYWITSITKDLLIKVVTVFISTAVILYIVIKGNEDFTYLILAFVNLLMFICFGLLSLVKAYDFFNMKHIPYLLNKLSIIEKENDRQHPIPTNDHVGGIISNESNIENKEKIND